MSDKAPDFVRLGDDTVEIVASDRPLHPPMSENVLFGSSEPVHPCWHALLRLSLLRRICFSFHRHGSENACMKSLVCGGKCDGPMRHAGLQSVSGLKNGSNRAFCTRLTPSHIADSSLILYAPVLFDVLWDRPGAGLRWLGAGGYPFEWIWCQGPRQAGFEQHDAHAEASQDPHMHCTIITRLCVEHDMLCNALCSLRMRYNHITSHKW